MVQAGPRQTLAGFLATQILNRKFLVKFEFENLNFSLLSVKYLWAYSHPLFIADCSLGCPF